MEKDITALAKNAFGRELAALPPMSLRAGNAIDGYESPPPYDAELDQPSPQYLEAHHWGLVHLDAASWKHYLPHFIVYAVEHQSDPKAAAVDALLLSLRPPDRVPPRLGSLSEEQEQVVVALLDALAFGEASAWRESAMLLHEEYWAPGALYRSQER